MEKEPLKSRILQWLVSLVYSFVLIFFAAFVGVYVNDFNSNKPADPPLRDIFLDRVPKIPDAFSAADISMLILLMIYGTILVFHKDRLLIMTRYNVLIGTIYFLRTCLVWSTTFPDSQGHECIPFVDVSQIGHLNGTISYSLELNKLRVLYAWRIVSGFGMPLISKIHICGDYLFSGHVAQITMHCYLIREYMPKNCALLIITWILNLIGAFGVLAAHEHYMVDVLVAFYLSAMLVKYHHAKSRLSRTSTGWIPGIGFLMKNPFQHYVPNNYDTLEDIKNKFLMAAKLRLKTTIPENVV